MPLRIGIVGVPPLAVIETINRAGHIIVDLDEPQIRASIDLTASRIPRVYCAILRTVVLNCLHLPLDQVYIDVGPGKCDCALHVAEVLADMLHVPVIRTRNQDTHRLRASALHQSAAAGGEIQPDHQGRAVGRALPGNGTMPTGLWLLGRPAQGFLASCAFSRDHAHFRLDPMHGKQDTR